MGKIKFQVNDEEYTVRDQDVSSDMMLVDYLRTRLELRGTKYMCREGGCGACIVSVVTSPGGTPKAVNACLISITQCHDWDITTIEKVGNKRRGYHPIQLKLAEKHGTQCGHCSPGWVMAMYSLAQSKKELTQLEIENSFGSNICRCTGYRPIMEAFKTFAKDAPNSRITDIEDLYVCDKTNKPCNKQCEDDDDWCFISNLNIKEDAPIEMELTDGKKWYIVKQIDQIFKILSDHSDEDYMLVSGNTSKGAYPVDVIPSILIDINNVSELQGHIIDQNLIIGANTTLTNFKNILKDISNQTNFEYLKKLADHVDLVAHIAVRNVGSIAGNLMTKHKNNGFYSDIFLLLETVGAWLSIIDSNGTKTVVSMQDFLKIDMNLKILYNIMLPPLNDQHHLITFKVMPRAQSTVAIVNSGFMYKLQKSDNTVLDARIVIGGLSPTFIRALKTENHLKGKVLFQNETLQSALKVLEEEIVVEDNPKYSTVYRKKLALSEFYKGLLALCPLDLLGPRYRSGAKCLHTTRPVSKASQTFSTDSNLYPLNEPIQKVEGLIQCAGEAAFTDDVPSIANELYAELVLSTVPLGTIESIDPSDALKMPGVNAFYSAKDIPGVNSFQLKDSILMVLDEEVFCSGEVKYFNQPLGVIVAESAALAERAAKRVKVTYTNVKKPMIDVKKAKNDDNRSKMLIHLPSIGRGLSVYKTFQSNYTLRGQIHFCMENIVSVAKPTEFGIEVHASTQWMDPVQVKVAEALKMDANCVEIYTRRVGGGFGLKGSRSILSAVACSLAAHIQNRPVRLVQSFSSTARALGKRMPCSTDVDVEVSKSGRIQHLDYKLYSDSGHINSALPALYGIECYNNCYHRAWWNYKLFNSITDTAMNSYFRAPGSLENIACAETIMEQISYELSLDPYEVRMTNLNKLLHSEIISMGRDLKEKAEYEKRRAEVDKFNAENMWKKQGLRWAFMKYNALGPGGHKVILSVSHEDGSVTICHSGIELGQGINTKAIQIAAHFLGVPVDKIKVKPHNTITTPNCLMTGASVTSQNIGMGVEACCKTLLERLAPIRVLLVNPTWKELIQKSYVLKIDLQTSHYVNDILSPVFTVYGITLAQVEVDILTGESVVRRVDLQEDVGRSVSPQIDVGQVEGAFIMGMSYWMFEKVVYDEHTGEVLSDRPWDYHVAQCKDIPEDFRISFRENSFSSSVVLGAKVTGEPATCLGIVVPFAAREALVSARQDRGIPTTKWFTIDGPWTPEQMCLAAETESEDFLFH